MEILVECWASPGLYEHRAIPEHQPDRILLGPFTTGPVLISATYPYLRIGEDDELQILTLVNDLWVLDPRYLQASYLVEGQPDNQLWKRWTEPAKFSDWSLVLIDD